MRNCGVRNLGLALMATLTFGSLTIGAIAPVSAQVLLEQQGNLQPAEDEYTFSGQAGQTVVISLTSPDFDTVVRLLDPSNQEIAVNDDYGRSLNSQIVLTLPRTGTYKVMARAFSGGGGNYSVTVRPATEYDEAFDRAYKSLLEGDMQTALTNYDSAIRLDPNQPDAYLGRADVRIALAEGQFGEEAIADYRRAAALYEESGNREMAQMLRDQIEYMLNPPAPIEEPTP
ncbi:tetratricopeptide repeat protein [Microcoleus sp. FACHB-1515]|uniref:PPC domain-containing protein n=1 Tax=Cyanophyceae TaxID=3028117 RepID=UPI00168735F1|nr:PPC domain-containing protein [Microcoleus sp. FACHB-1515]MBD2092166.1 tetratricopeptide repeat protein [Microcoleus sp. FACHB-1515]